MNTITTRSIAALAATGAIVAGGAAAANATGDGDSPSGATPERSKVTQLVFDAVEDGTVTLEEEDAIKQAIEAASSVEFASLDEVAEKGSAALGNATSGDTSERVDVSQLIHDAAGDGTVTLEEENVIKQAIADKSNVVFESLDAAAPQG
jgi:hypothetical protein